MTPKLSPLSLIVWLIKPHLMKIPASLRLIADRKMDSLDNLVEIAEVLEDVIEYVCDKNMISGELAWSATATIAAIKLDQLTAA